MLSQFPIERCVDFLAFQTVKQLPALVPAVMEVKEESTMEDNKSLGRRPSHMQAQGYIAQRVSPGLVVWELCLSFSAATQIEGQFWFRHNSHAPKPGQCLYVAVANMDLRIAVAAALASAPPYNKTFKDRADWALKSHRPRKIRIVASTSKLDHREPTSHICRRTLAACSAATRPQQRTLDGPARIKQLRSPCF